MAVTLRYFTEFGKPALQETICGGIYASVLYFLALVQCRRKESSRSLSHLLMSFLSTFAFEVLRSVKRWMTVEHCVDMLCCRWWYHDVICYVIYNNYRRPHRQYCSSLSDVSVVRRSPVDPSDGVLGRGSGDVPRRLLCARANAPRALLHAAHKPTSRSR